ncbi:hypothetical protein G6F31_017658 [Rhizopus arrhizus]|nr:hypothetical protein G6F31_017658 [Rhizopus arrhizus]
MPVQLGHVGHGHQLARPVHLHPGGLHRLRIGLGRVHGRAQLLPPRAVVQQVEHPAPAVGRAACARVVGDEGRVHVRLDGAFFVHDDGSDAGLAAVDEVAQEATHVQAGAGQADDLVAIAHLHVDPDFGGLEL